MKSIEDKLLGQLYCFCGGGDDPGGGKQDRQMDELDQIAADFENMSQQAAAGETVTSGMAGGVGRGGDSNDNDGDGIPNSIDATPGVDRSSIGAANYFDQAISDFGASPVDIFGPGTPAQDSRSTALGSPNDIRNAERQEALQAQQFGIANALQKMGIDPKNIGRTPLDVDGNIPDKMLGDEKRGAFFGELDVLGEGEPDLVDIPTPGGQLLSGLINAVRSPVQITQQAVDKGATPVTDKYGFTVGATSPTGDVVYDIDPFSFDKSPEMQEAYNKMREMQDKDRGGDNDREVTPAVTAPVAPATCPPGYRFNEKTNACEYVGQVYPGAAPYSGQPITASTQYTGIGGLSPFVLQPSYTPPASFAPLYNVG
jgi:hypothetical protein